MLRRADQFDDIRSDTTVEFWYERCIDVAPLVSGILTGMSGMTTIKVSKRTRDALRQLAHQEGLTLEQQLERLLATHRRRSIGAQLASDPLNSDERLFVDASAVDVADASR